MKRLLVVAASALALAGPAMAQSGGQSGPQGAPRVDVAAAANRTEAAIPPPAELDWLELEEKKADLAG